MTVADEAFICELLNQPSFLQFIGDRHVRSADEAGTFIETRYRQSYRDHGYGLYVVETRETSEPMGICGFVRREALPDADMGFAFLTRFEGRGYAYESAAAALEYAGVTFGLTRVLAIAQPDNTRSHTLLRRLGFSASGEVLMPGDSVALSLFVRELSAVRLPPSPGTRPAS